MQISGIVRNAKRRTLSEVIVGVEPRTRPLKRSSTENALVRLESAILQQINSELSRKEPRADRMIKLHSWLVKLMRESKQAIAQETQTNGGTAPTDVDESPLGDAGDRLLGALADGDE